MTLFRQGDGRRVREGGETTYIYHALPAAVAVGVADLPGALPESNKGTP